MVLLYPPTASYVEHRAREWVLPPVAPIPFDKPRRREETRILDRPGQKLQSQTHLGTRELTLAASLGALYIVSTFIPVSVYIGGAGFITLAIIISPLIASLLKPIPAAIAAGIGALGMALAQTAYFPAFQAPGLLIPIVTIVAGSIAFHYRWGALVPLLIIISGAIYYIAYSHGTLLWLVPYGIAVLTMPSLYKPRLPDVPTGILCLHTAMVEQVILNVESIAILGLTGPIWAIITPLMFVERTIAVLGGTVAILALKNRFGPSLFQPNHSMEVSR